MRQALEFKSCAQDCRALASKERNQQFKSMLLALAAQIDDLAEARQAYLEDSSGRPESGTVVRAQ